MGYIHDKYIGAFCAILNDRLKLIIPVINEIFREEYIGDEKIDFSQMNIF